MLEKFFKRNFVSFYFEDEYKAILEVIKNKKVLESEEKTFAEKKDLEEYILNLSKENPQTYISTILTSLNQGVVDSCQKARYREREIDIGNVKILCLENYSFFASIYDIKAIEKEYKFEIDFLYSLFAIIDYLANERKNRFYILILKNYLAVLGFENRPIFGDINSLVEEEEEEEIEEIDDLDIIDDLGEDIEVADDIEDIEDIEDIDEKSAIEEASTTNIEMSILKFLKDSLKEYYEHYSNEFIEKIILLDCVGIDEKVTSLIEDELLIPTEYKKTDILKTINRMSIESL